MQLTYSNEIEIELPRSKVIELFDNPDNLKKWQKGLLSFEHISGEAGKEGAKSRLNYQMGNRKIVMIETVTARNLPDEFSGTYEANGVWNKVENHFTEAGEAKTLWKTNSVFKGTNLMMKLMLGMMPGMFKKQTLQIMNDFKQFAESDEKG